MMFAAAPRIERVTADNPGPMTLEGTNSYVLFSADDQAAVMIDPGPALDDHLQALGELVGDRELRAIILTHHHWDHSDLLKTVDEWAPQTPVFAVSEEFARFVPALGAEDFEGDNAVLEFGPAETDRVELIPTPGHTLDSISVVAGSVLFSGDTVLGRGTTIIMHGDGSVDEYIASLEHLRSLVEQGQITQIQPAHGAVINDPAEVLDYYLSHRRERLDEVRAALVQQGVRLRNEDAARGSKSRVLAEDDIAPESELVNAVGAIVYPTAPDDMRPAVHSIVAAQLEYVHKHG